MPGKFHLAQERLVRENSYSILGTSEEKRDEKLDRFIAEQSAAYPNCLMSSRPPQKGKPKLDPLHLTRDEFDAIAAGKMSP